MSREFDWLQQCGYYTNDVETFEDLFFIKPEAEPHISYQFLPAFSAGLALVIIITMFWDICVIQFNPGRL